MSDLSDEPTRPPHHGGSGQPADGDDYYVTLPRDGPWGLPATAATRRSWPTVLGGAIGAVAVALGLLAWVGDPQPEPSTPPPAAAAPTTAAPTTAATAPEAPAPVQERGFAVWARNEDGSAVRWNACEPIPWVMDTAGAPEQAYDDVTAAMERIASATGLTFAFEGYVDERPRRDRNPYQPDRYGDDRWAPVLVAWASTAETDVSMSDNDRAVAIPVAVGDTTTDVFVSGQVVFNADKTLPPGFGDRHASWGSTILHELGHLVGLDHVEDPRQLMFAYPGFGPVEFGKGDLAGLEAVGADHGCLDVPEPAAVEVTYQEDFGH